MEKDMERYLLGLDVGTSSLKTAIIDENGRQISKSARGYEPMSLHPGWQEISAESIIVISVNLVLAAALFLLAYRKNGLE